MGSVCDVNETSSCFSIHSSKSVSLHVQYSHNRLVAQPAVSISVEERGGAGGGA